MRSFSYTTLPFSYTSWLVPLKATTQPPSISVFILPPGLWIDTDESRSAVFLCGGDCTGAPGGSQRFCLYLSTPFGVGLIGWYTYDTRPGPDDLIRTGTTRSPESLRHD